MEKCPYCKHAWHGLACTMPTYDVASGAFTKTGECGCATSFKDQYA